MCSGARLLPQPKAEDAFCGEVLCTFVLVLTVFAATDGELMSKLGHIPALLPFAIGMAVLLGEVRTPMKICFDPFGGTRRIFVSQA